MFEESSPTLVEQAVAKRAEWAAKQPSLTGQLAAMGREGLKDLQNAILPAFPDSQRGVEEPGTPLSPTPQQVTQSLERDSFEAMLDRYAPPQTRAREQTVEMER